MDPNWGWLRSAQTAVLERERRAAWQQRHKVVSAFQIKYELSLQREGYVPS